MAERKLFDEYPVLQDDCVILRKMTDRDADALKALTENRKVYASAPTFLYELQDEDKHRTIAEMDARCMQTGESVLLGIYLAEAPEHLVGVAEIYNYEENKQKASIGYRLSDAIWGRGIASRVCTLLKDYLLRQLGLRTITGHVLRTNQASARTAIKNGFVCKYPGLLEDWGFEDLMLTDKYVFKKEWLASAEEGASMGRVPPVRVEQFVMAYGIEQDRIRAMVPEGYESLRPVLRINAEIRDDSVVYIEFNTPATDGRRRGWLNIANWKSTNDPDISFKREGASVTFETPSLRIRFTKTGLEGGCPAEPDNEGCFFIGGDTEFRPAEKIEENKEFCDCTFAWRFHEGDAAGESEGKTIPAYAAPQKVQYERQKLSAENAAGIPCRQVLGAYVVELIRQRITPGQVLPG